MFIPRFFIAQYQQVISNDGCGVCPGQRTKNVEPDVVSFGVQGPSPALFEQTKMQAGKRNTTQRPSMMLKC